MPTKRKPSGEPARRRTARGRAPDPLQGIEMRLTYRTMRVLLAIGECPGATNREIAEQSGTKDEGQMSRLLSRLEDHTLIENTGDGKPRGGSNSWKLTERGEAVRRLIDHWQGR
ncbi:MAG: helix-turn-helix domain-containing protein [Solirubrobacteraceae bacterium]